MDVYTIELPQGLKLNVELGPHPITIGIVYPGGKQVKFEYLGTGNGGARITRDGGLERWSLKKEDRKYRNRVKEGGARESGGGEIEYESTDEGGNRHD